MHSPGGRYLGVYAKIQKISLALRAKCIISPVIYRKSKNFVALRAKKKRPPRFFGKFSLASKTFLDQIAKNIFYLIFRPLHFSTPAGGSGKKNGRRLGKNRKYFSKNIFRTFILKKVSEKCLSKIFLEKYVSKNIFEKHLRKFQEIFFENNFEKYFRN